jgi:exopolyphosphatase/guanosine-5'-triphosphate,3'-diphosphate pyrophosphatase
VDDAGGSASKRVYAVIEIGSIGIRLLAAEVSAGGEWKSLDRATKPISLGRDVFTRGSVSRESSLECIQIIALFREQLRSWQVAEEDIHIIATSAIRAASNRDLFIDRVQRETGYRLIVVEGIEENRLMYLAVRYALKDDLPQFWRTDAMIVDVGGGSTELMLLRQGKMAAAHSLRLGTILINPEDRPSPSRFQERYFNETVRNAWEFLNSEMDLSEIRMVAAAGSDARLASHQIGRQLNPLVRVIDRSDFLNFVERIQGYSIEECVQKLHLSYADAESFIPGLLVHRQFLQRTNAGELLVPTVSIREGYLIDLTQEVDARLEEEFFSQVIASALSLGRKYHFDEPHHIHVRALSLLLFDALVKEHGMKRRDRLMLEVAAVLHDVGMFVHQSGHHEHGQYIVSHSDIFGLHQEEIALIANVIRYHRGPPPSTSDFDYIALQREERILVLKLASLLRVADALDRSHSQRVSGFTVERREETVLLRCPGGLDLSMEKRGLNEKGDLFENVFGYRVLLPHQWV